MKATNSIMLLPTLLPCHCKREALEAKLTMRLKKAEADNRFVITNQG